MIVMCIYSFIYTSSYDADSNFFHVYTCVSLFIHLLLFGEDFYSNVLIQEYWLIDVSTQSNTRCD